MLAEKRREKIRALVHENKSVFVTDLAKLFEVTEETIRRDLSALERQKVLTRTYGGAFIQDGVVNDINASLRESVLVANKQSIGACALQLISNGDSVFIDSSTTALYLARQLTDKRIYVTTDSLNIANALSGSTTLKVYLLGGEYNPKSMSFVGSGATASLSRYFFDKCFVSCRSITRNFGVTDSNEDLAEIRSMAINHSNSTCLLCDHSKFDHTSFISICRFDAITTIVTDEPPSEEWLAFLREKGIRLLLPEGVSRVSDSKNAVENGKETPIQEAEKRTAN